MAHQTSGTYQCHGQNNLMLAPLHLFATHAIWDFFCQGLPCKAIAFRIALSASFRFLSISESSDLCFPHKRHPIVFLWFQMHQRLLAGFKQSPFKLWGTCS